MNKWQFDQQYIKNLINRGSALLKSPDIPRNKKRLIKEDIKFFSGVLKGDFEYSLEREISFSSLEKFKRYIINKMRKQYKLFGQNLIDGIIALNDEGIFDFVSSLSQTDLSIDEQEELTLKNYEKHSKFLLSYAKDLFSSMPTSLIQCVENLNCSSYCYYSDINNLPFLIVDPTEMPSILNHEIQHGIEYILNFKTPNFLSEEGSIFFELLYLDILFKEQNYLLGGDIERLENATYLLQYVSKYFEVLKEFAKTDFQVPTTKFLRVFEEHFEIMEGSIQEFLGEEIASGEIDDDLEYLLSLLKAIKLRYYTTMTGDDAFQVLKFHAFTPVFQSDDLRDDFKIYESYINEMKQKSRRL